MHFNINTAVRFLGYLYRFINELNSGIYRNIVKEVFNIRIS